MTMVEALNRSFNLLASTIVGVAAFAFAPEIYFEEGWLAKTDDVALFLLGLFSLWWYIRRNNRFKRSFMPIVLVAMALGIQVFGFIVELANPRQTSENVVGTILFFCMAVVLTHQYFKTQRLVDSFKI